MKKLISLLLAVVLVATLCVPFTVSAADEVISSDVVKSITDGEDPEVGLGVAFLYTMNMTETQHHSIRSFVSAKAGEAKVVKLGAIVSNHEETGKNPDAMIIANATGQKLLNVEATKLWGWDETGLSYAVRITNIPEEYKKTQIYARPYYILEDGTVVYGDIANKSYFSGWCDAQPAVTLPTIGSGIDVKYKTSNPDKCKRIRVEDAVIVDRTVTLTFKNYTTNWITEETDYVKYRCYDANNQKITDGTIYIGCIDTKKNKIKSFTFDVPDNTAKVSILSTTKITYWTEWS